MRRNGRRREECPRAAAGSAQHNPVSHPTLDRPRRTALLLLRALGVPRPYPSKPKGKGVRPSKQSIRPCSRSFFLYPVRGGVRMGAVQVQRSAAQRWTWICPAFCICMQTETSSSTVRAFGVLHLGGSAPLMIPVPVWCFTATCMEAQPGGGVVASSSCVHACICHRVRS